MNDTNNTAAPVWYAAGLDGGGTKTTIEARTEDGRVLLRDTFGCMNLNSADEQTVADTFRDCMNALRKLPGGLDVCGAVCIGSAGVSNPGARIKLERLLRQSGYTGPLRLVGDHETAHAGALGGPLGAILIAGTGSICFGRNASGHTARAGGYGHKIDDEGSGYALGRDALAAVVRAHDGRIPPTQLSEMVFEKLNIKEIGELIQFVYDPKTDKKQIAAFAPLVEQAREAGDAAAQAITARACGELAQIAGSVVRALGLQKGELAMAGSILLYDEGMRTGTQRALLAEFPHLHFIKPRSDAAAGAALLAWDSLRG